MLLLNLLPSFGTVVHLSAPPALPLQIERHQLRNIHIVLDYYDVHNPALS